MRKIGAWYWTVIAGVVIATLKVTTAAADSAIPTINLQARCRTSEKAMLEILPSMERGFRWMHEGRAAGPGSDRQGVAGYAAVVQIVLH
jgi:hypothetical protein